MNRNPIIILFLSVFFFSYGQKCFATDNEKLAKRQALAYHIHEYYPKQLGDPQKKTRKTLAQFGYGLSYFRFPMYPITSFIHPRNYGLHSYGKKSLREKNGSLYTCRGGFMDFSHIRCGLDWTVFITFKIITDGSDFELTPESGTLSLHFKNLDKLSLEEIAEMAQKIAYERLTWHEIASWHYHRPNHIISEQQSAFTPEDIYSNFLGTEIGKRVALRILRDRDTLPYSVIATQEIKKMITSLEPVHTKNESKHAYDVVDRYKQAKLTEEKRNGDTWYDSHIIFQEQRYMYKRYIHTGPELEPWLVPTWAYQSCSSTEQPAVMGVPELTHRGDSFYDYYEFRIKPAPVLFYAKKNGRLLHQPFAAFSTKEMDTVMNHIKKQMTSELLYGFDQRDNCDPVIYYSGLRTVYFK